MLGLLMVLFSCRCSPPSPAPLLKEESFVSCWPQSKDIPLSTEHSQNDSRLMEDHLIVLHKAGRRIMHYENGRITLDEDGLHCWRVGLGGAPEGHKKEKGDQKTPEGWYRTSDRSWSKYYGAINIHYPNAKDAESAFAEKRISKAEYERLLTADKNDQMTEGATSLGGLILIHGSRKKIPLNPIGSKLDWTDGCAAMEDDHLDKLRELLPKNMRTNILILP